MHLSECITREKTYMVSNLYLKFSELQLLEGDDKPFGSLYGATSSAVLTEFFVSAGDYRYAGRGAAYLPCGEEQEPHL